MMSIARTALCAFLLDSNAMPRSVARGGSVALLRETGLWMVDLATLPPEMLPSDLKVIAIFKQSPAVSASVLPGVRLRRARSGRLLAHHRTQC